MKKHLLTALLGLAVSASAWAAPAGLTAPQPAVNDDGQTAIVPVKPNKSVLRDSMVVTKGDFSYELFTDMTARLTRYNGSETDVVVPASVDTLGMTFKVKEIGNLNSWNTVFNNQVVSVTIPEGVTSIGYAAFEGCSALTSITIPKGVTTIGGRAFVNCTTLTAIEIPEGVTTIGPYAFFECKALTSITLPNTLTTIEGGTFSSCSALTSITIPKGVTAIGFYAFNNCTALTSITLPNSITGIETFGRFDGCTNLSEIKLSEDNPNYATDGKIIFTKDMTTVVGNVPAVDVLTIPATVTSINNINWNYASMVDMKGSAPRLDYYGSFPPKLIKVPGEYADEYKSSYYWINLRSAIVSDDEILQLKGVIYKLLTDNNAEVKAAEAKIQQLDIPSQVSSNGNVYTVTGIGDNAFANCIELTSITLPNTLTSIGGSAFSGCSALTSIALPNAITSISDKALYGCSALTSITLPNAITSIGSSAFAGCSSLTSITLPNTLTSIRSDAFNGCSALTSIVLPNTLTSIEESTFQSCTALTSITLPNTLTSIAGWAFNDCSALTSITLPNTLTSIGEGAFYSCSGLRIIKVPESITTIGYQAFESGPKIVVFPSNIRYISLPQGTLYSWNSGQIIVYPGAADASYNNNNSFWDAFLPPHSFSQTTWAYYNILDPEATYAPYPYDKELLYQGSDGSMYNVSISMTIKPCTALSVSDAGYATYFTNRGAYTMPDGLKGAVITGAADDKLAIDWRYEAGDEVPSATPLLLKGNAGDYYLPTDVQTSKEPDTDNLLKGTETMGFTTADYEALYYKLSYNNEGTQLGFYWGAANGGVFFNPANRCYLALPKAQFAHVKGFSLEGDDTITAITDVTAGNDNAAKAQTIYTLDGRKVNATTTQGLPAGLYIVNGVKTLVK